MKHWNDFIQKEDLESEPGLVDMDKIRALSVNTWLLYIGEFVKQQEDFPMDPVEQVEDFMVNDFMNCTRALEGRRPEPDEIRAYLDKPENVEAREYWSYICAHATKETWPLYEKMIREDWKVPEEVQLKNEDRIERMMEKNVKDRKWIIREF